MRKGVAKKAKKKQPVQKIEPVVDQAEVEWEARMRAEVADIIDAHFKPLEDNLR